MNEKQLFDKINKEAERNVPDMYDKILRSAKMQGLMKQTSGNSAPRTVKSSSSSGGNLALASMKKRLIALALITTAVFITLAAVIIWGISKGDSNGGSTGGNDDHVHAIVHIEQKTATCTTEGNTEYWYCSTCESCFTDENGENKVSVESFKIEKLPHNEVTDEAAPATCTEDGKTAGKHCSACGEVLAEQTVIPAPGHVTVVIEEGVEATCTEDGLTDSKGCSVCGKVLAEQTVISAPGHDIVTIESVEVICTKDGLTEGKSCSVCGEVLVEQTVIPAPGHNIVTIDRVDATCVEDGLTESKHCSACGEVLVEQTVIPAPGHVEVVVEERVDATCTEDGLTASKRCPVCGELLAEQTVISALGHEIVEEECTRCDVAYTKGLDYTLNKDGQSYSVAGIGTATDTVINITPVHDGKPVTAIGGGAFFQCETITSLIIPDSVTSIANEVCFDCFNLSSIVIPDSVTHIDGSSFTRCAFTSLTIPDSLTYLGDGVFSSCNELTSLDLGNGIKYIGGGVFSGSALTSVVIPDSVTYLGGFSDCSALADITIPDTVESIGHGAFAYTAYYNDKSNWQDEVFYLGKHLIDSEHNAVADGYEVREGTVSIADRSLTWQKSLTTITIPDSVVSIGEQALRECTNLAVINYKGTMEQWQEIDKGSYWCIYTGEFIVHCTDGDFDKSGNVIS